MKQTLILATALVLTLGVCGTAEAQTYVVPCYEWDCVGSPQGNCDFDAGNCSTGGGVWYYHWDFGDGTTDNWNGVPTASHYYPGGHTANVTLTLTFFGKPDESTTCSVKYRNVIGPPDLLAGDCDSTTHPGCNCQ